jgi:hypothetical protein
VVTFLRRPAGCQGLAQWNQFIQQHASLLKDRAYVKKTYLCDAFFVDLDAAPEELVNETRYWFGLFSHRRVTMQWKGVLQVPLLGPDESLAMGLLGAATGP